MSLLSYTWALPLLPIAAFVFVLAGGRRIARNAAAGVAIAVMAIVFAGSLAALYATTQGQTFHAAVPWISVGDFEVELGILVDPLAAVMLVIVSFVSLLVQIYSLSYMSEEERFRWYYGAISLFTAAMLGVVLADGWLLMYMCWEVMGLASYLLIGFWYEDPVAARAASKAFLVTRFGDVGFGLSLVVMWWAARSFSFETVFHMVETGAWAGPTLVACTLLLFMGAMGKSAQFPLHVWLPDAMAGPTPGSALIHAATMVAAGVYLVGRSFPLYEAVPQVLTVIAFVGTITAVMAALIATAMSDIKKVLAYSTVSQLGYMMIALGMGSAVAGIFHLMTHAFFKALLFLAAGSVIHACHTQEMREMGGLWKKMPWTTATWVLGALSLAGIPPLAGFWSKDEILLAAWHSEQTGFLVAAIVTAALTAFYMGRATFLTFFAKPGADSHSAHAHESPWVMTAPLAILATLAVTAGFVNSPVTNFAFGEFLGHHAEGGMNLTIAAIAVGGALAGIAYAWSMYLRGIWTADWYLKIKAISLTLTRLFWIDEAYELLALRPSMWIAGVFRKADAAVVDGAVRGTGWIGMGMSRVLAVFDRKGIDGVVDGLGDGVVDAGGEVRRIQTGNVQTYLLMLAASIVVLVLVFAR